MISGTLLVCARAWQVWFMFSEVSSVSSDLLKQMLVIFLAWQSLILMSWSYGLYIQLLLLQPVLPHGVPQHGDLLDGLILLKP